MQALLGLLAHPDLEWNDLLDALECTGVNAETAGLNLHSLLEIPMTKCPILDRGFWEHVLQEEKIHPSEKVVK